MTNGTRIPHALRLVVFFLRLTLGANFFYLGFSTMFNTALGKQLGTRSLTSLYTWIGSPVNTPLFQLFSQWAFLTIGACLIIGFLTRTMSVAGIALILVSFVPNVTLTTLNISQLINDEVLVIVCLLVLVFANAGTNLGIDNFIHIHFSSQHKK